MGFTLIATIKNKKSTMTPDEINLVSFGLRKGEEVEDFKVDKVVSMLENIRGKYRGMKAMDDKAKSRVPSAKPLTFSWFPRSDRKPFFRGFTGKPLTITITIQQEKGPSWQISFVDAVLSSGKPDIKTFPPDNYKRTDERFDGTFKIFNDDK